MKLTYDGPNSEHMLDKPTRNIKQYSDGKGNYYTVVEGEDVAYITSKTFSVNEEGFRREFMKTKPMSLDEFNKLKDA